MTQTKTALNVLVTGFGPFPGVDGNPTAWLARQLRHTDSTVVDNVKIHSHILETAWHSAPKRLARLYQETGPDIALHFGFSARAQGFCLERRARNRTVQAIDHIGDLPPFHKVMTGKAASLETPFPVRDIADYLLAGEFPARISDDAGSYICNMAYYLSLALAQDSKPQKTMPLFVHIPPVALPSGKTLPKNSTTQESFLFSHRQLITGVWHIIRYCRDFHIGRDDRNVMM